jgi:flagellar M-ring protein FliF
MGIPGSRSNLPGAEVQNQSMPMSTSSNERNSSNANYAIPRKIQIVDKPSGSIKRLTVAVVVDGLYTKTNNTPGETFTPRPEEELRRIQDLVANAVGFDTERRDSITVSSMPFNSTDLKDAEPEQTPAVSLKNLNSPLVRSGVITLIALTFLLLVLRPFLKWISLAQEKKESELEELTMVPRTVGEIEAAVLAQKPDGIVSESKSEDLKNQMEKNNEDGEVIKGVFAETESKREEKQLRNLILENLEKSPKKGFRIIQDWLDEDSDAKSMGVAA